MEQQQQDQQDMQKWDVQEEEQLPVFANDWWMLGVLAYELMMAAQPFSARYEGTLHRTPHFLAFSTSSSACLHQLDGNAAPHHSVRAAPQVSVEGQANHGSCNRYRECLL